MRKKYSYIVYGLLAFVLLACEHEKEAKEPIYMCTQRSEIGSQATGNCYDPLPKPSLEMVYRDVTGPRTYQLSFSRSEHETLVKLEILGEPLIIKVKTFSPDLFFDVFYQVQDQILCYSETEPMTDIHAFYQLDYIANDGQYCRAELSEADNMRLQLHDIYEEILSSGDAQ